MSVMVLSPTVKDGECELVYLKCSYVISRWYGLACCGTNIILTENC